MLLFCKKINVEIGTHSVLTPTFSIEPKKTVCLWANGFFYGHCVTAMTAFFVYMLTGLFEGVRR